MSSTIKRIKIDVGLSLNAPHAISWLQEDPDLFVIGFEPVKECLESVRNELKSLPKSVSERFLILNCALSDQDGESNFYVTSDFGTSSLEVPTGFVTRRLEQVRHFRLDEILDLIDFGAIGRIDYLKTDCQGHDLKVLKGAETWLTKVAVVTCESWAPGYTLKRPDSELAIRRYLRRFNFRAVNRTGIARVLASSIFHNLPFGDQIQQGIERALVARKSRSLDNSGSDKRRDYGASDPTYLNLDFEPAFRRGEITYFQTF